MQKIKLKCHCGEVKGFLRYEGHFGENHISCFCDDCQCFAHYLNKSDEVLDELGGTEIFQVNSNQVVIEKGQENIRCLKLSPKGTSRFYAKCCDTPIANMASLKISFAGIVHNFIDNKDEAQTLFGPVKYKCMSEFSKNGEVENASKGFSKSLVFKILCNTILGKINKSYLPNSFFSKESGLSLYPVDLISRDEKNNFKKRVENNL